MPHVRVGGQLVRLEDHLQVGRAARLLDRLDLVRDARVVALQIRLARDHHVDLARARGDRVAGLLDLDRERRLAGREAGRHGGDVHAGPLQRVARDTHQRRVHADGRDGGDLGTRGVGADRLRAQVADLAGRVGALERRQVDHRRRDEDALALRGRLDRAAPERGGALFHADPADGDQRTAHPRQCGRRRSDQSEAYSARSKSWYIWIASGVTNGQELRVDRPGHAGRAIDPEVRVRAARPRRRCQARRMPGMSSVLRSRPKPNL